MSDQTLGPSRWRSLARAAVLLLFFGATVAAVVLYATHRPLSGRWCLLLLALAWWLRARFFPEGAGPGGGPHE